MRVQIHNRMIYVDDTRYEDRAHFGRIPGSRWNKRKNAWLYPRSPFVVARLARLANSLNQPFKASRDVQDLLHEMRLVSEAQRWKTEPGRLAIKVSGDCFVTKTRPWFHQMNAWMFGTDLASAYYAMDMGTGKTLVAINEILEHEAQRSLIVCPKPVIQVWVDEFEKHVSPDDMPVFAILDSGNSKQKAAMIRFGIREANAKGKPLVVVVNYESAWRTAIANELFDITWDYIALDEGHKIKAAGGVASRFFAKLGTMSPMKRMLSGTPLPNNQLDAYGQFRFLDPGLFGTNFQRFRSRYAMMGEGPIGKHQVQGWINQDEFNHLLNLLMFRVDSEVLDLPPAVDMRRYCALEKEALRVYSNLEAEFISDVGTGVVTAGNALTRLLRLQQVTSGFVTDEEGRERDLGSEKATLLATLLEDIPAHEKIVVFCRFRHDLRVVRECAEAAGRAYGELSGTDNDLEGGQIPSHVNVLGTQIQAGGLGVNLIAARHCVFYSLGFSLGDYLQARKRVHRGGQEKNVVYTHLIAQGTVDEKVYEALEKKEKVVEAIMDYVKKGDA